MLKCAYFLWENAGKPEGRSEDFRARAVELEKLGEPPPTDVAAVLTVINRRTEESREREQANEWHLDFRGAVLRQANLYGAHLEGAVLDETPLQGVVLEEAHLEGAVLYGAHLEGAYLDEAHLEGAVLDEAHLQGANFGGAHLERAYLSEAHLEGANLFRAEGLTQAQIEYAFGDADTKLPEGLTRPAHWRKADSPGDRESPQ